MTLIDDLRSAGLTGRGGAAFSTAVKVAAAYDNRAALLVNACDGELGAAKDAYVVADHLPELVEGARLLTGGSGRVRYAAHRGSDTETRLTAAGLDVLDVPSRYVSSEESALISLANRGLARPMTKRAPFVQGGRDSRGRKIPPTVVLNAETVWRVAQIAAYGPDWFRGQGTEAEPGPRLVTVCGAVPRTVVVEAAAGMPIPTLLDAAGGLPVGAEFLWVGGLGGVLVPAGDAARLRWSGADLAAYGGSLGPGVVDVLDPRVCPVDHVDRMLTYAAGESAGQCGPCMFGLPAVAADWHELAALGPRDRARVEARLAHRLALLPGRGACRFPDGVARFAASARRQLAGHLEAHAAGHCPTTGVSATRRSSHVA
ncbi:MAG: NADH-ubiquinone oxidoreductase-F iron-sulfur binding region domain-containing protein [Dermatophilaceae bacterium]